MAHELYLNKAVILEKSSTVFHFQPQGRNRTSNHEDSHDLRNTLLPAALHTFNTYCALAHATCWRQDDMDTHVLSSPDLWGTLQLHH